MAYMQAGTRVRDNQHHSLGTVTDTEDKHGYVLVELDGGDIPTEFHVCDLTVWDGMECLELAWRAYAKIASVGDYSLISRQSVSWESPKSPYDFAALAVRSLIPFAYGFDKWNANKEETTDRVFDMLIESFELLSYDNPYIKEAINEMGGN